jgi:hypothetical protein
VGVLDAGEGALEWNACVHAGSDEGVYEAGDEDGCGGRLFLCGVPGGVGEEEIFDVTGGKDRGAGGGGDPGEGVKCGAESAMGGDRFDGVDDEQANLNLFYEVDQVRGVFG